MLKRILNFMAVVISFIIILSTVLASLVFYSNIGFFADLREIYVQTAMTTLNHQYLATIFISRKEIDRIMSNSAALEQQKEKSDTEAVKQACENENEKPENINNIEVFEINETTYRGKLMIINDPSRVKLATSSKILKYGEKLEKLIANENAIGGINASGFNDPEGKGNGGIPVGIVIKDGQIIYKDRSSSFPIIGFNYDNVLVLGRYKKDEISSLNLRDAVSFTPYLVVNGKPQITKGNGGWGIQPRTAIGQTIDGKVLMLVIDGRQIGSIGITLKDLQDIMVGYGAYNAANLDGGSSTVMYYEGNLLNSPCSVRGERLLPNAFVIK